MLHTVTAPGSIAVTQADGQPSQNQTAELHCSVCPTLTPEFTWSFTPRGERDVEIIANQSQSLSPEYTITTGRRNQTLTISNAQWSNAGVYVCIASMNDMMIQAEADLDVLSELCCYGELSTLLCVIYTISFDT